MTYTTQNLIDINNSYNVDTHSKAELNKKISEIVKGKETVCAKKRASKNHKRWLYCGGGFDTETSNLDENCALVYIWQFTVDTATFYGRTLETLHDFLIMLSSNVAKTGAHLMVYGANISYDFQFIKNHVSDIITDVFATENRKIINYTILDNIHIFDCLGIWGNSLAKCSEHTTRKKLCGELDYSILRTPYTKLKKNELLYCIHDTLICSELVIKTLDEYIKKGCKPPLTQTGIVRNELKDSYTRTEKKLEIEALQSYYTSQKQYNAFRQYLYSGGLTHSNSDFVGVRVSDVISFDIESSYPYQMMKNFPNGNLIESNGSIAMQHKHFILYVTIKNICSKSGHTLISEHKIVDKVVTSKDKTVKIKQVKNGIFDNGRLFSADEVTLLVNEIDLDNLKKIYNFDGKVCIHKAWYFTKSGKISKKIYDMVIKYYKEKTVLKRNGLNKTIEYTIAKQKLNSLYGMLCTQLYSRDLVYNKNTGKFDNVPKDWNKCNKSMLNCFTGYWVSSYARQQLVDMIHRFPSEIIQYDTDSIYCIDPNGTIKKYVDKFNKKSREFMLQRTNDTDMIDLGHWDDNGVYTQFCGYGAKRYAGISKKDNLLHITWAGGIDKDIKSQFRLDKKLHKTTGDIFEYLKQFECLDMSTKKTCKYIDKPQTTHVNGHEYTVKSCVVISNTSFKSQLKAEIENFKHKTQDIRNVYIFKTKGEDIL